MSENELPPGSEMPSEFLQLVGLRQVERKEGFFLGRLDVDTRHKNLGGVAHGGVYMIMIDTACGAAGTFCPHLDRIRRCVTVSINVSFTKPVREGLVTVTGELITSGKQIFTARATVRDTNERVLAHGTGSFKFMPGSEVMDGVPREDSTTVWRG